MKEQKPITFLNERQNSSKKLLATLDQQHQQIISANEQLTLMQPEVEVKINVSGPIRLVPIGDTHLFSRHTDTEAVKKTLKLLEEENTFGFITGDFIEGSHPHISDHTGTVELDFGKQIVAAAEILRPYFYSNKLLCAVDGYFGHEGWSKKNSGISSVEMMSRLMPQLDMKDPLNSDKWKYLPVLTQGGLLKLKLNNNKTYTIKVFHDPNSGGSDTINRQGSLKTQFLNEDDDLFLEKDVHADMYIAGHLHHRGVVSKEVYFDRMGRKEKSVVFVQVGTAKGTEKDKQDPFLVAQSKGPTVGPGPVIFINQTRGDNSSELTKEFVSWGYETGEELKKIAEIKHKAEDMLNLTERQKLTQELLGTIIDRTKKPSADFNVRGSGRSPKEKPGRAPLFDELKWNISNPKDFPVLVYLLQGARYGSSSRDGEPYRRVYEDILNQASENPYKYVLAMRHFVDKGVARRFDRRSVLRQMAGDLSSVNDKNRLLGLMLSSTLLDEGWKKDVIHYEQVYDRSKGKWVSEKEVDEGFRPGDELYYKSGIKGAPLYVHESIMYLNLGKFTYSFFLLDKLGRSGSEFNLVQGLVQTRKKEHVTTDITTGGHMPLAGFSIYPPRSRYYIVPGGLSNWDAGGKGNDKRVATAGQGAILFSDQNLIYPTSSLSESVTIFDGSLLDKGLTESEKKKLTSRNK